jgi:uncharacterized damage-inducible protein DinB
LQRTSSAHGQHSSNDQKVTVTKAIDCEATMKQNKWFERNFPMDLPPWIFSSILERLRGTPARLEKRIATIPDKYFTVRLDGNWSIQENIGHLLDLEPLWNGRLEDLLSGAQTLRPTDLANTATNLADHNAKVIQDLLRDFRVVRMAFVKKLETLLEEDLGKTSLHPRMDTPMNIIDKMFFVAEHDDHHLACITEIWQALEDS